MGPNAVSLPLPKHTAVNVGGLDTVDARQYALLKDEQFIVVETPPSEKRACSSDLNATRHLADSAIERDYNFFLEIIQQHIQDLRFGQDTWVRLLQRKDGSYYFKCQNKIPYQVASIPWARMVDESEIEFTVWLSGSRRRGIWRGLEVNLQIGWNDFALKDLEHETNGQSYMLGLDLTFPVLGHITRNGLIIGLMTEYCPEARMVEYGDRRLVYEAVSKIQNRGLLYRGLFPYNVMISDGKVRFLSLSSIFYYGDANVDALREEATYHHWQLANELFDELRTKGNLFYLVPFFAQNVQIICKLPSPGRPLIISTILHAQRADEPESDPQPQRARRGHRARGPMTTSTCYAIDEDEDGATVTSISSTRRSGLRTVAHSLTSSRVRMMNAGLLHPAVAPDRRLMSRLSSHPYRRGMSVGSAVFPSDASDMTSESGLSDI